MTKPPAMPDPQPAQVSDDDILTAGHRLAWRYKHSTDPSHSSTYTFNRACLLQFARAILTLRPQAAQQATPEPCKHILYKTGDADKPREICDRNGEVVLAMCRICGKAEAELVEITTGQPAPPAQTERVAFEAWLRTKPEARLWNTTDAMLVAYQAGRASLPAPQQATPDLADGPARMHWTNWMPVKDALEYAYQKMGLEMVKIDAGAKYPNLHWNLAGLVREFVVAQQDAMFGKCQACGKSMGLLDQIKCLDCGTRLCEPCAKEHFGGDHGARAAASHSHPAPTTSGWVETSAPPQRLDWSDTQQATPERHLTVTTNQQGEAVTVSWQDDEHRILDVVWERKPATPEPVGEPFGWLFQHEETGRVQVVDSQQVEWGFETNNPRWQKIRPVYTRPAPGVPDVEAAAKKLAECMDYPWEHMPSAGRDNMRKHAEAVLAAAQAKGGQA